jgi:hypothetical protein
MDCNSPVGGGRRDAYSLIFFNHKPSTSIENDFTGSPDSDELLAAALQFEADGGTDFTSMLERAEHVMTSYWSTERYGPFSTQIFLTPFSAHQLICIVERPSLFSCQTARTM